MDIVQKKYNFFFEKEDWQKIILIMSSLIIALFLIYYFHVKLKTSAVFTHFFYIPIIIASLWREKIGHLAALFLGMALILSHIFFETGLSLEDDIIRAAIFLSVSIAVGYQQGLTIKARETKMRLDDIVNSSNDAIIGESLEGIIQTWNLGAEKIFKYSAKEIIGQHISVLVPHERSCEYPDIIGKIKKNQRVERYETVRLRKDGKLINVSITVSPVKNSSGEITGASIITRDITQKKILEEQFFQAQKRQAIGTLAGGIAHDFNNILMPIIGYAEITADCLPKDSPVRENLRQILISAERAKDLVCQILTFTRENKQEKMVMKAQYVIKEALKLIRATLPSTIKIHHYIDNNCGPVLGNPTHIHQIVMNLCTNAFHAMQENGGIIEVSLKETDVKKDQILTLEPGKYILLTVSDTGHGINPSIIEKIFEPYFTTKEHGRGTGLGLAVVQGIVKGSDGEITVKSETGKGSIFNIYLPRVFEQENSLKSDLKKAYPEGSERILIVDDEPQVAMVQEQMLKNIGYKVTAVSSSIEALNIFRKNPEIFDLVITDQSMPDIQGIQLAKNIIQIRPDIPIILCTGFSNAVNETTAKDMGINGFIKKPFSKMEIAETIRQVLEK
ncbi:Two component system response regulator/histidine kinase, PAS domain-containing [Desulfonema limicola]|uniref:histidine kinase n=1 Tax=Desulfonema limicola TaxID=45656 RepID=A0A975GJ36_9BACT|nr:response regulator [Desulfonema limicola]QTA83039.1 Two component system response regulator/histidine kinase, PAS domain-containing [Desulfonema limicola]